MLTINGREHTVDADPSTPLLWALRDVLDLTGTKFGCGVAQCGACTVHLDGEAVRSCVTPISRGRGKTSRPSKRIAHRSFGPAVHAAWVQHDVAQCGYCQSGQMMSAIALLVAATRQSPPTTTSTRPWPATSVAAAPISAFAPPSRTPRARSPEGAACCATSTTATCRAPLRA